MAHGILARRFLAHDAPRITEWVNMRRASRRQDSMRRESEDTPLLEKVEIFSDQGISAPRSLAHICAKDLGASFPTAEIPQRRVNNPPPS